MSSAKPISDATSDLPTFLCYGRMEPSKNYATGLKVTGLVISLLVLMISMIALLASTGTLAKTSAFFSFGKVGIMTSSLFFAASSISTVIFCILMSAACEEKLDHVPVKTPKKHETPEQKNEEQVTEEAEEK